MTTGQQLFFRSIEELVLKSWIYERIGFDKREMTFEASGAIGIGRERCEISWNMSLVEDVPTLNIHGLFGLTAQLTKEDHVWKGRWLIAEKMFAEIRSSS